MKILFTSDLHVRDSRDSVEKIGILNTKARIEKPDAIVVSGDISDAAGFSSHDVLMSIDAEFPVVYCLGNHEFFFSSVSDTLEKYSNESIEKSNVHCLDVEGYVDICGVRFAGNVLWYDGSLLNSTCLSSRKVIERISPSWMDSTISGFDAWSENRRCIEQIKSAFDAFEGRKILVTHCVPHRNLNVFDVLKPDSLYNAYSGVENLFDDNGIYPDIALCGHTHRRSLYEHRCRNGRTISCYNSGNDYFFRSNEITIDIIEA